MSEYLYAGLTSQTIDIFLQDSSSSTGQGLAGLLFNTASLVASYRKGATGSRVAITLATQTVGAAYSSGGFVEIDATHMKGVYRLDLPNAAVDTEGFVTLYLYGATNLLPTALRIDCRAVPADVKKIGADAQSATDLKDFADAGYDPATNKVQGVVLVDTTTTLTTLPTIPTNWFTANGLAADAVAEIADGVWDETTAGHTASGTYGGRVVRSMNSNVEVQITGSHHIAADVHDVQPDGLTNSTEIAAINTFATRVTTGIVQDGVVWQFTANMLELGPSGGGGAGTVNVLPATGIVADRSAGTTLLPVVGETISQAITVYQSDGTTAVNLSGKTLAIIFETMSGTDVAVVANANITISGVGNNVVTFAYPSAVTASERTLRFAIRDAAAPLTMYLQGVCSVVAAPKVDA